MNPHRLINTALFCAIIGVYGLMASLDGPADHQAQADQLQDLQAAIQDEARADRFTKAAAVLCGTNASYTVIDDHTVQCLTKRGHKTQKVSL